MRLANVRGRLTLLANGSEIDVEQASRGRFGTDPQAVFAEWAAFRDWAPTVSGSPVVPVGDRDLGPPVPRPAQVFGIGLNYAAHAAEAGLPVPDRLATFTSLNETLTTVLGQYYVVLELKPFSTSNKTLGLTLVDNTYLTVAEVQALLGDLWNRYEVKLKE